MAHPVPFGLRSATVSGRVRDAIDEFAAKYPSRFALLAFSSIIVVFTVVLASPIASADGTWTPLPQAFFTATSAVCVTGLSVVDMSTHWSWFGNAAILVAAQIGGVGVLTMASMMGMVVSRRLGLRTRLIAASDTNPMRSHAGPVSEGQAVRLGDIGGLLTTVLISSLGVEALLFLALFPHLLLAGISWPYALYDSVYLAVSAFNNLGFVPFVGGLGAYREDGWVLGVLVVGVFIGSLGYPILFAAIRNAREWLTRRARPRWGLHVKLTLATTGILFCLSILTFCLVEWSNPGTLGDAEPWQRPFGALFHSVMTRSGGFSTFDPAALSDSGLLSTQILMFIGGGSASTAGGIKVTTLAVLFLAALAEARGAGEIEAFDRRIPTDVLRVAVSIVLWGTSIVVLSTMLVSPFTDQPLGNVLFETISAFATCGLSTGVSSDLADPGVFVLGITMWAGRVGTVTLAAAIASTSRRQLYRHAEERPIVG